MNDDMDWRDGSVQRTLPDGVGLGWSRSRGRRRPRRRVPWVLLAALVFIAVGIVLWLENRRAVPLRFFSVHATAPLWVIAVGNLVLGLILGAALMARSRR
jgi:uncharacterized integral membrane protein